MKSIQRVEVLKKIVEDIKNLNRSNNCFFVGIDGYDGAGKTYFGNELEGLLELEGIRVIRSSVDFFHNTREYRYKQGRNSPKGFYEDSYNYSKLKELLLNPLKKGLGARYKTKYFNVEKNDFERVKPCQLKEKSVLVFDGIFLHRKELVEYWDYSIFLEVSREETLRRCYKRDKTGIPLYAESNKRYIEGQKVYIYLEEPRTKATVIIDNEKIECPKIIRMNKK